MKWYQLLIPVFLTQITRQPRQRIEADVNFSWSKTSWTHNVFRCWELIAWRRAGVRREMSSGKQGTVEWMHPHTLEAACALFELYIRVCIRNFFTKRIPHIRIIQLPSLVFSTGVPVKTPYTFAIAFDASSLRTQDSGGGTTSTWAHTCTGSDGLLLVGTAIGTGKTASGVTYNAVSATQAVTLASGGLTFDNGYLFRLVAPATGANNIVVTVSADTFIYSAATSYSGVDQTSPIDATGTNSTTGTSVSVSITTTVDNDWLAGFWWEATTDDDVAWTAGANTTIRQQDADPGRWYAIGDTNSAQTPTGSKTISASKSISLLLAVVGVAFSPSTSAPVVRPTPFLSLLGVGT